MNGKPQEIRKNEREDLLEQIITQGLDKMNTHPQAEAGPEAPADEAQPAPEREDSGKAVSPTEKKNRRSAVYLYLLILFGAAFLMLLLAYLIQQRSSESTISDLRNSMNLSRQELLDEIRELEEQNDALSEDLDRLNSVLKHWQKLYAEEAQEGQVYYSQLSIAQEELYSWQSFWALYRYYLAEDYEGCAALFLLQLQGEYAYIGMGTEVWRLTILEEVIDRGLLDEDYASHPSDYDELLQAYLDRPVLFGAEEDHGPTITYD